MAGDERVYVRNDIAREWGDEDPFAAVQALRGEILRDLDGRRTQRVTIGGASYYVKHHRGVGWLEIIKNLLLLRLPVLDASNERDAAARLTDAGVKTLSVAGFGRRGVNPATRESFVITDAIEHEGELDAVAMAWTNAPARRLRHIYQVADITRTMHACGINHRDLYLCHFLLGHHDQLHLIDLHRAQIRDRVPHRWLVKDLGSLVFSAAPLGLSPMEQLRFVRRYTAQPLRRTFAGTEGRRFWDAVSMRARQLQAKAERKGMASTAQ